WHKHLGEGMVGHAAIFEKSGKPILSQFPANHFAVGRNQTLSYPDTRDSEHGHPDLLFKVHVTDDKKFDEVANEMRAKPYWSMLPMQVDDPMLGSYGGCSTNCVDASARALDAGGVPVNPSLLPDSFGDQLSDMAKNGPPPGAQWSVQAVPTDTLDNMFPEPESNKPPSYIHDQEESDLFRPPL